MPLPFSAFVAVFFALAGCLVDRNLYEERRALLVDADEDGATELDGDCDDTRAEVYTGAPELCDALDNDCDGAVDDYAVDAPAWYADTDEDGYGNPDVVLRECDAPGGYTAAGEDCDDSDADISPIGTEVCDGADNDCDGETDEDGAAGGETWYADGDGDGWGNAFVTLEACAPPEGYTGTVGDCDDTSAEYHPGAAETDCSDPHDYNCDGSTGMTDADGDGAPACLDCDDGDPDVNAAEVERCNGGVDDDCDGLADADDDAIGVATWYEDTDGDGYGEGAGVDACEQPDDSYVERGGDCATDDSGANPGETEVCNGEDDDCDGETDEGVLLLFYADADADGFGDPSAPTEACGAPSGYVEDATDCDDTDAAVNPGEVEACDAGEVDENCSGSADDLTTYECYVDADGDGYGTPAADAASLGDTGWTPWAFVACDCGVGYAGSDDDCDDEDPAVNPGAAEDCAMTGVDEDCDGGEDGLDLDCWP